jgi:BlaI family penicillinase repressor
MTGKSLDDLGRLQRAVMEVVWDLGRATVHQVRLRLTHRKDLAYTTVLTAMQKLEKAGWLRHRNKGNRYVYYPTRTRDQASAKSLSNFIKHVFDGDAVLMFQHLIRQGDLTDDELRELRNLIDRKRRQRK